MQDIFIQSKVIDIIPKFKMATAAILDFQFMWIWPFRRVDSVVFVFCTKFGSNLFFYVWPALCHAVIKRILIDWLSVIVTEIDAHMLQTFIWWPHAH